MSRNTLAQNLIAGMAMTVLIGSAHAASGIKITEWMYNSNTPTTNIGEFVEFTNFGPSAIDMTGWSFDDNSRVPGSESLTAFGSVASGESVIFTELAAADFRTAWGLSPGIKVIGGNLNNLGRSDEINLYDSTNTLVDRLTYNDQGTGTVKGPRTVGTSGIPTSSSFIGANIASGWKLSVVGDADHSYTSLAVGSIYSGGDIGSPGFSVTAVPEPENYALMLAGLGLLGLVGRRKYN